jgi:hypothetical protein
MFDSRDINAATNYVRPMTSGGYGGTVILDESIGTSSYNALSISVEKRMTQSLSFLGGYRWAKCLDLAGSEASFAFNEFTDAKHPAADRGVCNSNLSQQFKFAGVWRLPRLRGLGVAGRQILGGWTASGILTQHNGFPFSVNAVGDANEDGTINDRADLIGNPHLPGNRTQAQKLAAWFNNARSPDPNVAFATPVNADGNSGRNFLTGPGYVNLDAALIKSFALPFGPFRETQTINIRTEAFNVLNHPNFGSPDSAMADATFGSILSAQSPRILQFAVKYNF